MSKPTEVVTAPEVAVLASVEEIVKDSVNTNVDIQMTDEPIVDPTLETPMHKGIFQGGDGTPFTLILILPPMIMLCPCPKWTRKMLN